MNPKHRIPLIHFAYVLIDVFFIYLSIYVACLLCADKLKFPVSFPYLFLEESNPFRFIFVFWLLTTVLINRTNNLYETRREMQEGLEIWTVMKSVSFASLVIVVALYVLKVEGLPRSLFIVATLTMIFWLSLWRYVKRLFVEYLVASGYNNWNALIVGAGKVGLALEQELMKRSGLGIRVAGFLDDFKGASPEEKKKILGKIADFAAIAPREFISILFITIHHDSQVFLRLLEEAKEMNITVRVVPQGYGLTVSEFLRYNIGLIPIIEYSNVHNSRRQFGKRLFDCVISLILMIGLIPVFLLIALAIKLDSPGPVFYQSRRYGRRGRIFHMAKFRSMLTEADKVQPELNSKNEVDVGPKFFKTNGKIFKIKNDPRITRVGHFLRKYSLDELPQIFNVFRGEMSLVGPRPLPIDQVEKENLRHIKRLEVRPGITGLWQIRGRSDISFYRLVRWDEWYIENWSFWLDMNILFQTFPVVIKGKGAY